MRTSFLNSFLTMVAVNRVKRFKPHEFTLVFLSEILYKIWGWNLLERKREIEVQMDRFGQPLFDSVILVLSPEFLHLLCSSLWDQSAILDLLPEGRFVKIRSVVGTHDLEQLNTLDDCELFLFTNVKLFARRVVAFRQFVVIFLRNHLSPSNLHRVALVALDCVSDPVANKN